MNHNDNKILSHSTWNCKYHIVFAPKYRRKIFYESHRKEIMEIIKELCRWKEVEILEGEMAVDHVHLLLMIPPKLSVSGFMGYLKGKSSLMIYQRWGAAKYQYRCREYWCRGYYVDTVTYFYGQFLSLCLYNVTSANSTQIYSSREHPNIFANVRLGLFFFTKLP